MMIHIGFVPHCVFSWEAFFLNVFQEPQSSNFVVGCSVVTEGSSTRDQMGGDPGLQPSRTSGSAIGRHLAISPAFPRGHSCWARPQSKATGAQASRPSLLGLLDKCLLMASLCQHRLQETLSLLSRVFPPLFGGDPCSHTDHIPGVLALLVDACHRGVAF